MMLTERHRIRPSHPQFKLLWNCCKLAKNLYNHANYIIRQRFINDNYWVRYVELDKLLKVDVTYPDYKNMPTAQSAQQLLRGLDKNWKSFFAAIKDWKQHPDKYSGRPKLPKYKKSVHVLVLTSQECKLKQQRVTFPKIFQGFTIRPKFVECKKFCMVRVVPYNHEITVELVYEVEDAIVQPNNQRYIGIDMGINNLIAYSSNVITPRAINGRPVKSMNQYYNKKLAQLKSQLPMGIYSSKRIQHFTSKRNRKIDDYLHKASKYIINICKHHQITTIIIGKNDGWKQGVKLGKRTNQNFVGIPFNRLIQMIQYKADRVGVTVVLTEESYTSGTSHLDNELPIKENYNRNRRVKRGLFRSNQGLLINADTNAAYQMIRKVIPNGLNQWDRGCGVHPAIVTLQ